MNKKKGSNVSISYNLLDKSAHEEIVSALSEALRQEIDGHIMRELISLTISDEDAAAGLIEGKCKICDAVPGQHLSGCRFSSEKGGLSKWQK